MMHTANWPVNERLMTLRCASRSELGGSEVRVRARLRALRSVHSGGLL